MVQWKEQVLRTLLFAPGNHPRKVAKVGTFGADLIVLDLEDAVAVAEKEATRSVVRAALPTYENVIVTVRVNALETGLCLNDIDAVVCPHLDAIMLPKVQDIGTLRVVDERLSMLEEREGLERGTIRVLPLIETALGVLRMEQIAFGAPPRVHTLVFGQGDFTTGLEIDLTQDATEIFYARSRMVLVARAAGMPAPIDGPYLYLRDEEGLVKDSLLARQLGFQGRIVIYPPQVLPVNWAYSHVPGEDVELARTIVEAFEKAEAAGSASIQVEGRFVDYPIYRKSLHKIRLHEISQPLEYERGAK
jgi:citrate lyase subunit beta/citryl-CoA lyase